MYLSAAAISGVLCLGNHVVCMYCNTRAISSYLIISIQFIGQLLKGVLVFYLGTKICLFPDDAILI
jgi:hypothetical protein